MNMLVEYAGCMFLLPVYSIKHLLREKHHLKINAKKLPLRCLLRKKMAASRITVMENKVAARNLDKVPHRHVSIIFRK
ncbi:hypothetical protein [Paenibacillus nasutitermitis]|uniref:hypothetical protein n=1 Tax=Paenibacillus nasutitermitis TaxID=1652958 RepID=UPI0016645697|nr:hypothetical protein [Paenibacillus nasutitermitis]